jgi:[glutamine synthetase] adenylyltransferase / [glutamine synthetase]-adenylyl-L-tyrosine phosphorylase
MAAPRDLLEMARAGSDYLGDLILRDAAFADDAIAGDPEALLRALSADLSRIGDQAEFMRALRQSKARAALLIGLRDLGGWPLEDVTAALTRFADAAVASAVNWLLREQARRGKFVLADESDPSRGSGFAVIAMGKQGAFELNYSSDIDIIVLYDPATAPLAAGVEPATFFVRLTKQLAMLLQDVTEDGYCLRVDLRLRPDPRATQVAIALESAAVYYENQGQNWERAAMIKARAAAGDIALGEEFIARLRPYVWRKYLDFAAIADVQSLKRQIHAVKGHGEIAVLGHNIKLGRGGIREIEFFVQTQQLIAGGRNPNLRGRGTVEMLDALAEAKWITPEAAGELQDAYRFLRTIEHRIQMVRDEQTHNVPGDATAFARLAHFAGFAGPDDLAAKLRSALECVQGHYSRLFEDAGDLGGTDGSLVFTGGEDDPDTIETLVRMGYRQASEVAATIRGWHFGRYGATRSARSRELLTELMPALLKALARTGEADEAFNAFDRFLGGLPAGVQLFSMLKANPQLLDLIATILGTAPRLNDQLSRRPKVLEAVIDPNFFGPMPGRAEITRIVQSMIPPGLALDEAVERARVAGREIAFRIGVRVLSETVSAVDAGEAFSALAEVLIETLLAAVRYDLEQRHGRVPGARVAVLAMGKLGGREMTAGSDLDLILVYDHAPDAEPSDGAKPLAAGPYFSRLAQRLIAALSAPTSEGVLYEVDMRLRPSGNKGPVATSLASFKDYHRDSSWTWEKMALTRARAVAGDAPLRIELAEVTRAILASPRDRDATRKDVLDMRRLMLASLATGRAWDIKQSRGGLVDIEFIAQYMQLVTGAETLDQNTQLALGKLGGHLSEEQSASLRAANGLYHRLTQVLRLCLSGPYEPQAAPAGLNRIVASAAVAPDIATAEALLAETRAAVARVFESVVGPV